VELVEAIGILKDRVFRHDGLPAAFRRALRAREQWPIPDLLSYRDIGLDAQVYLPTSAEWAIDVDLITKPKHSGDVRTERLLDIFTGTLLQVVADALMDAPRQPRLDFPFTTVPRKAPHSYESWAKALAGWLQQRLSTGCAVLIVDIADFFPSISPEQIHQAVTGAGLSADVGDAVLVIFDRINQSPSNNSRCGKGLPIIADDIVWIIADLVLRPFDKEAIQEPFVSNYARWVDDCFIACDATRTTEVLQGISDLAKHYGFSFNPAKTRILSSFHELDRAMLRREHDLLTDLLAIASGGGATDIDLVKFLPQLTARLVAGRADDTRLVKRMYSLASVTGSIEMLSRAANDLTDYPAAERQILSYLSRLGWPRQCHEVLLRSLTGDGYDSRQLLVLRLLLDIGPSAMPAAACDACRRMVCGDLAAHELVRTLASALLIDDASDAARRSLRRFARDIPGLTSSMARRVGSELLSIAEGEGDNWSTYPTDPSPLVRSFVAFSASPQTDIPLTVDQPAPRSDPTWRRFEERLLQRLAAKRS